MSNSNDRKLELERKKAKLAQIREEKKRKEDEKRKQLLNETDSSSRQDSGPENKSTLAEETEKILTELGISPHAPPTPLEETARELSPPSNLTPGGAKVGGASSAQASPMTVYRSRAKIMLDKATQDQINLTPKEQVLYSKTTQTVNETGGSIDKDIHAYEWDDEFSGAQGGGRGSAGTNASAPDEIFDLDGSPAHHIAGLLPHIELIKPAEVRSEKTISADDKPTVTVQLLNEEEKQKVISVPEFRQFFDRTTRIIERALTEKEDDIFVDYSRGRQVEKEVDSDLKLSINRRFFDEKWTRGRCVTSIDCNTQHPELLAVSYNNNEEAPNEPDGVVLIWNNKFKKTTPEYVFHCQSRVLSLTWARFHPNLLLGGTYSGQICLWDNRQNKRTPVQKSPLSASAHTHPVYCIKVVGTQNAHNLVSVSTDGKLCSWSLDMLAQPLETLDLQLKQSKQVAATCLDFPAGDVNNFLVGSEDGCAYSGCRHGQKAGIVDAFEGHNGPITGVACHAAAGPIDFSHLFLTTSFDWTVKLWNSKEHKQPLCSFEGNSDYIMDAGWSPIHPALFAVGDCRGRLDLWQLNQDTELPAVSVTLPDEAAVNKVKWLTSGHQIAVGDDSGHVTVYDVNDQLASPKSNEWNQLAKVLDDIKQNQLEAEELIQAMALSSAPMH